MYKKNTIFFLLTFCGLLIDSVSIDESESEGSTMIDSPASDNADTQANRTARRDSNLIRFRSLPNIATDTCNITRKENTLHHLTGT